MEFIYTIVFCHLPWSSCAPTINIPLLFFAGTLPLIALYLPTSICKPPPQCTPFQDRILYILEDAFLYLLILFHILR